MAKKGTRGMTVAGILLASLSFVLPAVAAPEEGAVEAVIRGLQTDWNAADMTAYLEAYRSDDGLRLVFGKSWLAGFDEVERVFREQYSDEERMGKFTIGALEVRMLSEDIAIATGTFEHVFTRETIRGAFTHVLQKNAAGEWVIQHEHTSRGEVIAH